jgi:hypothetical protein
MNGTVTAKKVQKTVIGQIASKTPAGLGAIVIKFTIIFIVSMLQKDTTPIIGVDHVDLAFTLCFGCRRLKTSCTNLSYADIHSNMATHFLYEIYLVGLQHDLSVLLATGTTLAALMKNRLQSVLIDLILCHFPVLR